VTVPRQGEIWWGESENKRRPYLIVTRSEAISVLTAIVAAPVSRTVRGIPTEIALGPSEGLQVECAASFDNLELIPRFALTERAGTLGPRRNEICETLRALADC
jgi:mRNA interferase MazF